MGLTAKQEQGLKIAVQRYRDGEKYTLIQGYAGSGKSYLVRVIIEALDIDPEEVAFATFTGKAAEVLSKKGNKNAMTLHKLLYEAIPNKDGSFSYYPKAELDKYKVVVVDEASMAPKSMMDLLFSFPVYVLILGDPFQLSPLFKEEGSVFQEPPHIFLDEIMRQATDSEIIRLSMEIRAGLPLRHFVGKDVQVLYPDELNTGMLTWADIVLCATNKTRNALNKQIRELNGFGKEPQKGDKIICTQNYWRKLDRKSHNPLINGTIGYIKTLEKADYWIADKHYGGKEDIKVPAIRTTIEADDGSYWTSVRMDKKLLITGDPTLTLAQEGALRTTATGKGPFTNAYLIPMYFEYGNAITVHRAQGSQWDKVLVIEENFPWGKEEHARHLYTSLTRAVDKCVIIKKR